MPGIVEILIGALVVLLVFLVGGGWLWWKLPKWQMRSIRVREPKDRADIEDNFRKTVGQVFTGLFTGLFVLLGAGIAYWGTFQTLQANTDQARQTLQANEDQARRSQQTARDLLISNQAARGFEQFGSDNVRVRLGGIYALGGVMNTSEQYYHPVLEALCTFVRDSTKAETGDGPPATDVQAALTVIGRRAPTGAEVPDLSTAVFNPGGHLSQAELSSAQITGCDLRYARLARANLIRSYLGVWRITHVSPSTVGPGSSQVTFQVTASVHVEDRVNLSHADLSSANLSLANLGQADLSDAILSDANLTGVRLEWADLSNAKLVKTSLTGAFLTGTKLAGADLTGAKLNGADLGKVTVSQSQLDKACGTNVTLDPGLTVKPC
jgi:hypothetical protein